jgi:NAD(P)-dependent dehydrogenase (short-subunit alcohol dehydrogenase family)
VPGVFITGIAGGIGSGIADVFAEHGWDVVGADVREHETWRTFVGDVCRDADVAEWFTTLEREGFALTSVINTAGINYFAPIDETDLGQWKAMFDVNVFGMVRTIKHAVPMLRQHVGATIVNMSSISSRIGSVGYAAYVSTKAAVDGLTRSLALELAPHIRVNAIAPGWIDAGFTSEGIARQKNPGEFLEEVYAMHALGRIGTAREVGDAVYWMASPASAFMVGSVLDYDGGYLIKN